MEIYGNIEALKKSIQKKYDEKIKEVEKRADDELKKLDAATGKKTEIMRAEAVVQIGTEANVVRARTLNEEKLKAKRLFEQEREKMILSVFDAIQKRKEKIVTSKKYMGYVKSKIPKAEEKLDVFGGSELYKKHFKDLKLDRKIAGILFKSKNTIYDFTIDKMLESGEETVREVAIKNLFGG